MWITLLILYFSLRKSHLTHLPFEKIRDWRYNGFTDFTTASETDAERRLILKPPNAATTFALWRTQLQRSSTFISATGRAPIPVQWALDPCPDSLPDPTTRVGFKETKNHNVKSLRHPFYGSMTLEVPARSGSRQQFLPKRLRRHRISHRHRVSAGTPCIANAAART